MQLLNAPERTWVMPAHGDTVYVNGQDHRQIYYDRIKEGVAVVYVCDTREEPWVMIEVHVSPTEEVVLIGTGGNLR
jgi:hypothetical protein